MNFVERERRIDLLCLRNMSDEQPSPLEANGIFDTAVYGTSDEIEMEERRSTRDRQPSVVRDREGDLNEKKLALQNSRAGYIGNLTKVHNEIVHLTESGPSPEDVSKECARFDKAWRKFVDAHESYLKLLDPLTDALVLETTQKTYDEQLQRKLNLDFSVRLWYKDREPERGDNYSEFSGGTQRSRRSGISTSSSRLSTVSRKREKLTLAQLNLRQLRIRQQLEQEMQEMREKRDQELQAMQEKQKREEHEIRRKRELVEAEMEAERAAVSLQVYEEKSVEQLQEKSFLDYLVPSSRKNEVPDNASKVSVNDQLAVHSENVTIVTSALSKWATSIAS